MKDLLDYIVTGLVDNPDDVRVYSEDSYGSTLLDVSVNSDDMGRVIGRRGKVINSIRTIVKAAAIGTGEKYSVELLES